jgi:hypothetical protein
LIRFDSSSVCAQKPGRKLEPRWSSKSALLGISLGSDHLLTADSALLGGDPRFAEPRDYPSCTPSLSPLISPGWLAPTAARVGLHQRLGTRLHRLLSNRLKRSCLRELVDERSVGLHHLFHRRSPQGIYRFEKRPLSV